jgi:hypothetical protein
LVTNPSTFGNIHLNGRYWERRALPGMGPGMASMGRPPAVATTRRSSSFESGCKPPTIFRIRVDAVDDEAVKAREDEPFLLPASCPERHINIDGSFYLYWAEAEPNAIVDASAAEIWWGKLLVFLKRQQTASCCGSGRGDPMRGLTRPRPPKRSSSPNGRLPNSATGSEGYSMIPVLPPSGRKSAETLACALCSTVTGW